MPFLRTAFCIVLGALLSVQGARAGTLKEVLRNGEFSICANPNQLPYSSESGSLRGFYLDIANAIAQDLSVKLKVIWVPFREEVRHTHCDAVMGSAEIGKAPYCETTKGNASSRPVTLSIPYLAVRSLLVVRTSHGPIHSLDDFAHEHVAVPSGSLAHMIMHDRGIPVWVRFLSDDAIIGAVANKKADAGVVSSMGYGWYVKQHANPKVKAVRGFTIDPRLNFDAGIALRHADKALVQRVDKTLLTLMRSGRMHAIFAKYGIPYVPPKRALAVSKACIETAH